MLDGIIAIALLSILFASLLPTLLYCQKLGASNGQDAKAVLFAEQKKAEIQATAYVNIKAEPRTTLENSYQYATQVNEETSGSNYLKTIQLTIYDNNEIAFQTVFSKLKVVSGTVPTVPVTKPDTVLTMQIYGVDATMAYIGTHLEGVGTAWQFIGGDYGWKGATFSYTLNHNVPRYYMLIESIDYNVYPRNFVGTFNLGNKGFVFENTGTQTVSTGTPSGWWVCGESCAIKRPVTSQLVMRADGSIYAGIWGNDASYYEYFMSPIVRNDSYWKSETTTTTSNISLEL